MIVAHVGGVPVEELLPSVTGLLAARAWMMFHVRRRRGNATKAPAGS